MGSQYDFKTEGARAVGTFIANIAELKTLQRNPEHKSLKHRLVELYSENVTTKVLRAAVDHLIENVSEKHPKY